MNLSVSMGSGLGSTFEPIRGGLMPVDSKKDSLDTLYVPFCNEPFKGSLNSKGKVIVEVFFSSSNVMSIQVDLSNCTLNRSNFC